MSSSKEINLKNGTSISLLLAIGLLGCRPVERPPTEEELATEAALMISIAQTNTVAMEQTARAQATAEASITPSPIPTATETPIPSPTPTKAPTTTPPPTLTEQEKLDYQFQAVRIELRNLINLSQREGLDHRQIIYDTIFNADLTLRRVVPRIERLGFLDRPTMEEAYRALKALNVILKALETKIEIDPPQLGEEVLYRSFLNNVDRFLVVVDWGQLAYENFEVQIDVEDTAARVNEVGQLLEK
mgnify:CR=1 FL=1